MEALLYEKLPEKAVECHLCGHKCVIKEGRRGICGVRENTSGTLETLVYNKIIACHVDPIEKKPLFHFYPGSLAYSVGTVGCNFRCRFCQNADIAQIAIEGNGPIPGKFFTSEDIVAGAKKEGCRSIAYTYNEPTVFFELALATATLARQQNIKNVFVTNGYMSAAAVDRISPVLDAANVDLKAFSDDFYKKMCGAKLAPVKETLKKMRASGIFVEVTTLVIPGLNDDPEGLKALAEFIVHDLGADTPWHVSRFYPTFRLADRPPTPVEIVLQARDIGLKAGLRHVYTGNIPGEIGEDTFCFKCGIRLIHRRGYVVGQNKIRDGRCPDCGVEISGKGMSL